LIDLDNVVMTQHNAGLSDGATRRMAAAVVDGMWEVLGGNPTTTSILVNPDVWERRRRYRAEKLLSSGGPS
jgi:phosphoglycerate dehydrogenase-like enzyme